MDVVGAAFRPDSVSLTVRNKHCPEIMHSACPEQLFAGAGCHSGNGGQEPELRGYVRSGLNS